MTSKLEKARLQYRTTLPKVLEDITSIKVEEQERIDVLDNPKAINDMFPYTFKQPLLSLKGGATKEYTPIKVGVVLSGGQAPGGHNVICGLFDALKKIHPDSILVGFLEGADGIIGNNIRELTKDVIDQYRNLGGFDMIGSARTKIETPKQLEAAETTARENDLDGIVVVGGDDSNTNAAVLAEYFKSRQCKTSIVGVPKTIDGDLSNQFVEISFGHDTACKTYSELIGNIARDAFSAKKYYHFIRLMGRSASHITLECALQVQPDYAIISEYVAARKYTLRDIISSVCNIICKRAEQGRNYGVVLVPEGLLEFIPEFKQLIRELNNLLAKDSPHSYYLDDTHSDKERVEYILDHLDIESRQCFASIPFKIQQQLLMDRDPHGNVRLSQIDTERLIINAVDNELKRRRDDSKYIGRFRGISHFMGYEGRSGYPSNFDCQYCYSLGYVAAALVAHQLSGYICSLQGVIKPVEEWQVTAVPITMMMNIEQRGGVPKPVIRKVLVDLEGKPFKKFLEQVDMAGLEDTYRYPGPIQFLESSEITDERLISLHLEHE
jgi:diphosphate-dependent phosphofructokinase